MEDSRAALGDRSCQRMPISADTLPPFPVPGNNIANSCLPWDIILSGWRGETQRRACNPIKASRRWLRRCCCSCCCRCSLDGAKASCFYTRPLRMEPLSLSLPCFLTPPWFLLVVSLLVLAIVDRIRNLGTKGAVQFFLRLAPFFDPLGGAIPSRL